MGEEQLDRPHTPIELLHREERKYKQPILVVIGDSPFVVIPERGTGFFDRTQIYVYPDGRLARKGTIRDRATFGRAEGNDFRVDEVRVSRAHGSIEAQSGGAFSVEDQSTNGTGVRPIEHVPPGIHELKIGERNGPFLLGDTSVSIIIGKMVRLVFGKDERGAYLEDYLTHERTPVGSESDEAIIRIGRERGNDVMMSKKVVSERHAELEYMHGVFYVTDLGSRNGTELWRK